MENIGEESPLPLGEEDSPLNCEYCEECFAGPSRLDNYKQHLFDIHDIGEEELTLTVRPEIRARNIASEWTNMYFVKANDGSTKCTWKNCWETIIPIGRRLIYSLKKHLYDRHNIVEPLYVYRGTILDERWQHYEREYLGGKRTYNAKCKYCSKNVPTMRDVYELKRHFDTDHKANLTKLMKKHFRKRGINIVKCKSCKNKIQLDQYIWKNMVDHIKTHCVDVPDIQQIRKQFGQLMDEFHKRITGTLMTEAVRTNLDQIMVLLWEFSKIIQPNDVLDLEHGNSSKSPSKHLSWEQIASKLKKKEQETTRNDE